MDVLLINELVADGFEIFVVWFLKTTKKEVMIHILWSSYC